MTDHPECVREWVEALERAIDEAEWHGEHADYPDRMEEGKADAARLRSLRDALMQGQEAWQHPETGGLRWTPPVTSWPFLSSRSSRNDRRDR